MVWLTSIVWSCWLISLLILSCSKSKFLLANYVGFVCARCNVTPTQVPSCKMDVAKLVCAMYQFESGDRMLDLFSARYTPSYVLNIIDMFNLKFYYKWRRRLLNLLLRLLKLSFMLLLAILAVLCNFFLSSVCLVWNWFLVNTLYE